MGGKRRYYRLTAKNSSFANFGLRVGSCDLQMCCFVRWVFLFFLRGRKNKINSHQVCTELSSKSQSIISCLFIQKVKISKLKFRSDTLAYNGGGIVSKGLRALYLSNYSKIWSGLLHPEYH